MDNQNNNVPEETTAKAAIGETAKAADAGNGAKNPVPPVDLERYANPEIFDDPAPAAPPAHSAEPEIDDDDDDAPTEWVPSRFERRIHAIPEAQWKLYQTVGGVLIGAFTVFALFFGGQGLNPLFLIAIVLALFAPNMLEDRGRRKLTRGRMVMAITIAIGVAAMAVYTGMTKGWRVFSLKKEAEDALRLLDRWYV